MDGAFIRRDLSQFSEIFTAIFSENRFALNPNKVWLVSKQARQQVTGLVVNKKVNVSRDYFRNLRAMVHAVEAYGYDAAQRTYAENYRHGGSGSLRRHILGKLAFFGDITRYDLRYTRLARRVHLIFPDESINIPALSVERAVYVVEPLFGNNSATAFHIGDGLFVTVAHVFEAGDTLRSARLHSNPHFPERFTATLLGFDADADIALLRAPIAVRSQARPSIKMGARVLHAGDLVEAIGFPGFNEGNSCSRIQTRISGRRRVFGAQRVEVDRPFPHGMSGGPVFAPDQVCTGLVFSGPEYGSEDAPLGTSYTPFAVWEQLVSRWRASVTG
jgi:hypothetical protein